MLLSLKDPEKASNVPRVGQVLGYDQRRLRQPGVAVKYPREPKSVQKWLGGRKVAVYEVVSVSQPARKTGGNHCDGARARGT